MARSVEDAKDFAELDSSVGEMPKIRGNYGVSKPVRQLMDAISDTEVHRIVNVGDSKSRARWGRKLRYAATKVGKEVSIVYAPEGNLDEKPAGLYFKGYDVGEAPTRGRRTQTSSITGEEAEEFNE